jgi:protein O-GlcNAc transferase
VTELDNLPAAVAIHRAGRLAEADALYVRLLAASPQNAEVLRLRGVLACQEDRFEPAVGYLRAAIELDSNNPLYHSNLGVALTGLGRLEDALAALQRAAELAPADKDIRYNMACLLQSLGRREEAVTAYEVLLAGAPDHADALSNLGLLLTQGGQAAQAVPLLRRALAHSPDLLEAHINLGLALHDLDRFDDAVACFRQALQASPDQAEIHYNLANALHAGRYYEEAIVHGRRAIELRPDYAEAHYNLGNAWRELGDVEKAVERYRQALALQRAHAHAWRNLLSGLLYIPGIPAATRFSEHRRFAAAYPLRKRPAVSMVDDPDRPLRIGYVSSDVRRHPVARNLDPILVRHRSLLSFAAVYAEVRRPDDVTEYFRDAVDLWRPVTDLSDEALAEQIRIDRIDILVHLAGRFDRNRPTLAAWRAAPVQISFHDPATSGFSAMDYLITDRFMVSRSSSERFVERPLRLPSFYTHAPLADAPEPGLLPAGEGRPVTFVSFNHPAKLNEAVLALWGQVLNRVPGSRLLLKHHHRFLHPVAQERVLSRLTAAGVHADRVAFPADDRGGRDHLQLYQQADMALDPFPFTGSTTTFEALWMGVPVVTLAGNDMVGRWSGSILHALKLDELIATSSEDYIRIAVALAADRPRLESLRRSLRRRLATSPLCDGALRARQLERLYRAVWRRWCAGLRDSSVNRAGALSR